MCQIAKTKLSEANEETVGFVIGPRLNAAGRLDHAKPAVELLMADDLETAEKLAEAIDNLNKERQLIVSDITKEAIRMVEEQSTADISNVLVIGKEDWNPGVIGIVASRLADRFYRPAIVLSYDLDSGMAKGSARSIPGFNLFKNLSDCADLLPHFGGHPMAAGMTLEMDHVNEFRSRLNLAAEEQLSEEDFIPVTELDASISLEEVSLDSIRQLEMLAPYGMKNPKPKVMIENASVSGIRKIGGNKTHLKLTLDKPGHSLDGIGFNLGSHADDISAGSKVSVIGELSINEWNNIRKPQIFLKDIAINEWQLFDLRGNKQLQQWIPQLPTENISFIFFNEQNSNALSFLDKEADITLIRSSKEAQSFTVDGKNIVLVDMPADLSILDQLVQGKSPARIYTHFLQENGHFFSTLPTRDHFKWYYAFLSKRRTFDVRKHGDELAAYRGWSKETIEFMSQVFFELEFVTMENGLIAINSEKQKKDLGDSSTYQQKQNQIKLEKELLYSSYQELKQWFDDRVVQVARTKEEMKVWI